jgi:hypothetical protein
MCICSTVSERVGTDSAYPVRRPRGYLYGNLDIPLVEFDLGVPFSEIDARRDQATFQYEYCFYYTRDTGRSF